MSYYAVKNGKKNGIYHSWSDAKEHVHGFKCPVFKRFDTLQEAEAFLGIEKKETVLIIKPDEEETNNTLICFTDGSAINNGYPNAKSSYAVVWPYHAEMNNAGHSVPPHTNNRGEYYALIQAFEDASKLDPSFKKTLIVYTDSMLMINSFTKWLPKWKLNNYKKSDGKEIANLDLVQIIEKNMTYRPLILRHVRSHQKTISWTSMYNNMVDFLAKSIFKKD